MKFLLKISLLSIFFFLVPFSIGLNSIEGDIAGLSSNIAYAVDLDCQGGITGLGDLACEFSEGILYVWEIVWFYSTQVILVLVGYILDIFIFLSIDSTFYRSGLIETGWEILRDFTNIVFIFSFLVMAFKMTLKMGDAGNKKQLVKTILVALTVNFSLFIGLAVIDASNLLAHVFYNRIEAKGAYKATSLGAGEDKEAASSLSKFITDFVGEDTRSVSLAIASNINPQIIITGNASKGFLENFIIITGAGLINVLLIFVFLKMMLVFLGRTLGLMFSTMMSAAAFVSLTIPGMENKKYIGFNKWLEELISTAFMAPVFLFFIYLAVTFLKDKGFLASLAADDGQDFLTRILVVFIPFLIIGGILMLAKKISTDMVGELGKTAVKGVGMLAGGIIAAPLAVGAGAAAIGGAAAVGAGGLASGAGAAASRMGASRIGGALSKTGRGASRLGRKAMSFKADPTKIPGFKSLVGKDMSTEIGKVTGKSALGHIRAQKKKSSENPIFGMDDGKFKKEDDDKALKDAKDKADKAKRDAESQYEAGFYQAQVAKARTDNDPAYTALKDDLAAASTALTSAVEAEKNALSNLNQLRNNGAPQADIDIAELAHTSAEVALQDRRDDADDAKIAVESHDGYANDQAYETIKNTKETAGKNAAAQSRRESAGKQGDPALANRILKADSPKDKTMEKILKKLEDNN